MLTAPTQTVVLLIELVIVIAKIADRYHTFAFIFVQFNVQSPFRNTGNYTIEHLSQTLRHKFYLLVFDGSTFSVGCNLFHIAGVVAEVFIFSFGNTAPAIQVFSKQAVYHHVRETTDG